MASVSSNRIRNTLIGAVFGCLVVPLSALANLEGPVTVLHGDALQLGDVRIQLQGLISPRRGEICRDRHENQQACGDLSAQFLEALIKNRPVKCVGTEFNNKGHLRALCFVGTKNLNGTMIRAGWALAEGRYGRWHESLEKKARAAQAGLWAGGSGNPWYWDW